MGDERPSRSLRLAALRKKRRKRKIIIGCLTCAVVVIVVLLLVLVPDGAKKAKATRTRAAAEGQAPKVEEASPATTSARPPESSAVAGSPPASVPVQATSPPQPASPPLVAPMDGNPLYPYTKAESIACGKWQSGSTDYPYFGAPREGARLHAGIDVYPAAGAGAPVKALKNGKVIKVALFYTRATGEKTYGVLIDHGDFVANYAEVLPGVNVGDTVSQGQVVGAVSGTKQLHFELYQAGTVSWLQWYGKQPANLIDPTDAMVKLVGN